ARIAEKNGQDTGFIQQRTTGWETYQSGIAALLSQQPLSPAEEKAAERAADLLAGNKIAILLGGDLMERDHGVQTADAAFDLALATGSLAAANGGIFIASPESNTNGAFDMGMVPDMLPGRYALSDQNARQNLERLWNARISPDPGLDLCDIIEAAEAGHIKGLYIMGENLLRTLPEADRVEAALKNLDFLVVQDIVDTRTARLAQVVLPGAASAEKGGSFTNMEGRIQAIAPTAAPPGQAKGDWEILALLAQKMGYPEQYNTVQKIRLEIRKTVPMYATLENHRRAWVKNADTGTPFDDGNSRFAFHEWQPPAPAETDTGRPFTALLGSLRWHLGGGTRTSRSPRIAKWQRDGQARLCPADMESLGLAEGDTVRIASESGQIERPCVPDAGLVSGQAFVPLGFSGNDAAALASLARLKDPDSGWRTCRVNIEKI
ncbi:MAG: molybdopterin-dependent oxidoreductase, partial [Desulfobacteraceae bacterium]|nr:molybdopterin-dependent oxidoreductase [Desulfobacteraceae bacterium]